MATNRCLRLVLVLPLLLLVPLARPVQAQDAKLHGYVFADQDGQISGATLTLTGPGGSHVQVTPADGSWKYLGLSPGTYSLKVERDGFIPVHYPNIVIGAGRDIYLAIYMYPTGEPETSLVADSPTLVDGRFTKGDLIYAEQFGSANLEAILRTLPDITSGQRIQYSCGDANDPPVNIPAPPGSVFPGALFDVPNGNGFAFERVDGSGKGFIHYGSVAQDGCDLRAFAYSNEGSDVVIISPAETGGTKVMQRSHAALYSQISGGTTKIFVRPFDVSGSGQITFSPQKPLDTSIPGKFHYAPRVAFNPVTGRFLVSFTVCNSADAGCNTTRTGVFDPPTFMSEPDSAYDLVINPPYEFFPPGQDLDVSAHGPGQLTYTAVDLTTPTLFMGSWPYSTLGVPGPAGSGDLFSTVSGGEFGNRFAIRAGADYFTFITENVTASGHKGFATFVPVIGVPTPEPAVPFGFSDADFLEHPYQGKHLSTFFTLTQPPQNQSRAAATPLGVYRQQLKLKQTCKPNATTLCLGGRRFQVRATPVSGQGTIGTGTGFLLSNDTGYFTFFNPANVELLVKVIDGCGLGGKYWVFAGGLTDVRVVITVTDMTTGQMVTIVNPKGKPFAPYQNTAAFSCGNPSSSIHAASALAAQPALLAPEPRPATAACQADATHLCLNNGRFEVSTVWTTKAGQTGAGHAVALPGVGAGPPDTGYFWFFSEANVEMVIKVLNACALNNRHWVFAGGLTDVKVVTTVRDTLKGTTKTYNNPQGKAFLPVQDTGAFATCP